ncbi:uncharacterized protein LOC101739388 isoform X4 [Bombyx mori]|uniref:uncharacterized protein LOC101739388 isoform X4 n=1 Tax=Bombyx mori TaxID=7091 RepID=UPI002ED1D7C5
MSGASSTQYSLLQIFDVFGKYQIVQYAYIGITIVFLTLIDINFIFVSGDLKYRCKVSECENNMSTAENPTWWPNKMIDRCYRPVLKDDYGTCNSSSFTDSLVQCTEWIYESNNTVVAELNLGCQPWRSNLIGTIHSFGMMTSMFVTGWIYDVWGRKPALVICIVGSAVGVLKVLVKNWYIYVMVEFLEACMSGGTYTSGMVLTYLWTKISLFLVGKMLISGCFTGIITYSMELFPTSVRGLLLGLGALTSRIGNMMAPLTPMLEFRTHSDWGFARRACLR